MGFYIRKSFALGKFLRLNVSGSGLGVSVGINGARIAVGPRGTEINAGRGPIRYRKWISAMQALKVLGRRTPS